MVFHDFVNFVVYDNPISKSITKIVMGNKNLPPMPNVTVITEKTPLWKLASEFGPYVRIGAVMGAAAVALGAYGAHKSYPKDQAVELKRVFDTANRIHFYHALAMFAVPMCRNPKIAGTLMLSGTLLFSGTCYYYAFTGERKLEKLTPIGGTILIVAWLSMVV